MSDSSTRSQLTNVETHKQNLQKLPFLDVDNHNKYKKSNLNNVNELLNIRKKLLDEERIERRSTLSEAEWNNDLKLAEVTKVSRKLTNNFSHSYNKKLYLYPEECLFLLEMKCLLLKENGVQLSIQSAYNTLLSENSSCSFGQYRTYAFLLKLGFRVFRHDKDSINSNKFEYNPQNLTIIRELPWSKKNQTCNNFSGGKNSNLCKKLFPKHINGWINLHKPQSEYLPNGLQPCYNTYSFNLSKKSNQFRIIKMITKNENKDLQQFNILNNPDNSLQSPKLNICRPNYEKNIPSINLCSLLPKKESCSDKTVIFMKMLHSECNPVKRKIVINDNLQGDIKRIKSQANNSKPTFNNIKDTDFSNGNLTKCSQEEFTEVKSKLSHSVHMNETSITKHDIPGHIVKKLYAVNNKVTEKDNMNYTNNLHKFNFDVYYPERNFPKTNKPLPDFRVIIFSFEESFPNMFQINSFCEFNNVPVLWAVVHSDSVSFYHVNNIVLPKPNEWEPPDT